MEVSSPAPFQQAATVEDGLVLWRISGRLDFHHFDELKSELDRLVGMKLKFYILDLEDLDSLDSRGLGFLIAAQSAARSLQGRLVLARLGAKFAPLLETTRLNRIFEIFLDVESAKASFRMPHKEP